MSSDRLDVVIFGASGYTGKYAIFESIKVLKGLTWGIAGRNKEKLENVLAEIGQKAGEDLSKTPIIIADVGDEKSLLEMAKRAKVIVNTCGPYRHWGEQVVKACIEAGTNHVDVSGEPQYMEQMQLKYNEMAREKGVYIVSACGFDSIPADMGIVFLQEKFEGTVNSVETYLRTYFVNGYKPTGAGLNFGTWESAVYGLAHAGELRGIRSKLFPIRMPKFSPQLKDRPVVHKMKIGKRERWCLPFPGSDRSVVMRSQRHFMEKENKRPVQMRAYVGFNSIFHIIGVALVAIMFGILSKFSFGRHLLLTYPKFFSAGATSRDGPAEETNENMEFEMVFYGEGWKETLPEPTDSFSTPPNKKITTRVSASNPGYGATCIALLLSATTILKDASKMPDNGGVFPPAAAFKNTNMISELQKHGFIFDVMKIEE